MNSMHTVTISACHELTLPSADGVDVGIPAVFVIERKYEADAFDLLVQPSDDAVQVLDGGHLLARLIQASREAGEGLHHRRVRQLVQPHALDGLPEIGQGLAQLGEAAMRVVDELIDEPIQRVRQDVHDAVRRRVSPFFGDGESRSRRRQQYQRNHHQLTIFVPYNWIIGIGGSILSIR